MGRGASKVGKTNEGQMSVPYENWGKVLDGADVETLYDKNGNVIGQIADEYHWDNEPFHEKITKSQILKTVDDWKNDDGTYGTGDEAIYIAYENGNFINLTDGDAHKRFSKQGISGVYISTADDQAVWGGEWVRKPYKQPEFQPYTTSEWDINDNPIEGYKNSYSGYKTTAVWIQRVKTTYVKNEKTGRYEAKRETIRKSTKKKYK